MSSLVRHVLFGKLTIMFPQKTVVLIQNSVPSVLGGISLAGVVRGGEGVPVPNRILHRYSLVYVFQGSGFYTDDTIRDHPVNPGDIIQIAPNTRHDYGPKVGRDWHEVYIIFEGPIFDTWYEQNCFELAHPVTNLKPIDYWRDRFLSTIGEPYQRGQLGGIAEVLRLQQLLLDIHKALHDETNDDDSWIEAAKNALAQATSSQAAAQHLGMSYESFRKRFRKTYGVPPARYHANLQMEQACDLLASTTFSIKEISRRLDYCDEFHFSKRFSQIVGCSPSTYRSRAHGQ